MPPRLKRKNKKYETKVLYYERKLKKRGYNLIIGVDEAGRGPLAGPVVAAAVTLKTARFKNRIDDSKKLTPFQREKAFGEIINKSFFGLGIVNEMIIDKSNILKASSQAMEEAIENLVKNLKLNRKDLNKLYVLVDGNTPLKIQYPFTNVIKGDSKSKSIASASILAKVTRDRIMTAYHKLFPKYNFLKHKGYPTREHRQAIQRFGISQIHRKTFSYGS